jgi:apolipoprotein N-acyltransferase
VSLLQGNVPQEEKFAARTCRQALAATLAQLDGAAGELVIGPETVIPLLPDQLDPAWWQALLERFRQPGMRALIGLPLGNEREGYTNSAAGISAETAGCRAASIATTSTTWCRSASSSRPAFAGSPS